MDGRRSRRTCEPAPVVLVSCYELGHEPLGTLVPAGVLARAGFPVRVVDVAVEDFDERAVAGARLVAISAPMHTALRLGARIAARVRAVNPDAHICFHGLYAGLHAAQLHPVLADTCLGAECETQLLELAAAIEAGGAGSPRDVTLPFSERAPTRPRGLDLAPLRSLPHHARYVRASIGGELRETGYVAATRGCKHTCRHCPIPAEYEGRFHALPVEDVVRDIDRVVARGARHVTFADADFLNGPTHALRVARELHRRHPGVSFDYTAKIEHLQRRPGVADELHALGAAFVVSAVESFNDTVLAHLDKGHTSADALAVIRRFRERGMTLRPSLVPFTPWETRSSLAGLFEIVAGEGLAGQIDPVQYSIRLLVPGGSLLAAHQPLRPLLGPFDAARFSHNWRHPDPGMDALQQELAAMASAAAAQGEAALDTFVRMRAAVHPGTAVGEMAVAPGAPPRLTEDWFC